MGINLRVPNTGQGGHRILALVLAVAMLIVLAAAPASASAAARTVALSSIGGNGQYVVGTHVKPGTYRSTNNAVTYCSWSRLSSFTGSYESILASDFSKGPQIVTIAATDKGFSTSGCGAWALLSAQATAPKTAIAGDGTFSREKSIVPGTYRSTNTASTYCSWSRLSGFSGTYPQTLASDFAKGPQIVTVSTADRGFSTSGCGSWALLVKLPTAPKSTILGDGTYSIPKSIAAGTYRSSNNSTTYCSWATLSGFSGTYSSIKASGFAKGPQVVKITSATAGFSTSGCNKWSRIGV